MLYKDYNDYIRQIFNDLISDGYKQSQICNATLGSQRVGQFKGFVEGKNIGIKPHERIMDSLGYELHLVPIPKNNQEKLNIINNLTDQFIQDLKFLLIEYLEDSEKMSEASSRNRPKKYANVIDQLSEFILSGNSDE